MDKLIVDDRGKPGRWPLTVVWKRGSGRISLSWQHTYLVLSWYQLNLVHVNLERFSFCLHVQFNTLTLAAALEKKKIVRSDLFAACWPARRQLGEVVELSLNSSYKQEV